MVSNIHEYLLSEHIKKYKNKGFTLLSRNTTFGNFCPDTVLYNEKEVVILEIVYTHDSNIDISWLQDLFGKLVKLEKVYITKKVKGRVGEYKQKQKYQTPEPIRTYMRDYMYKYTRGKIGYAFVVGDLLHMGHLHFLLECKKHCDFLICGVYTDELTETYKRRPIIPFEERIELIRNLKPVDMVVTVHDRDCTPVLKQLIEDGWKIRYLFHGTDWNPETDSDLKKSKQFIESVGGELIQPEYYKERTTSSIIREIIRRYQTNEKGISD